MTRRPDCRPDRPPRPRRARRLARSWRTCCRRRRPIPCSPRSRASRTRSTSRSPTTTSRAGIRNALQPLDVRRAVRGDPGAPARPRGRRAAYSTPGAWCRRLSSIAIHPGESAAADPRRRPAAPAPEAARADRLQHDVGAHRLHRGERGDPHHPGLAHPRSQSRSTARSTRRSPPSCGAAACSCGTAASGTAAAPTSSDAVRVGIAMNYCAGCVRQQENQQLGIPREIARGFASAPPRARGLRRLPRPHRPHRQAQSR